MSEQSNNKGWGIDRRLTDLRNALYLTPENDVAVRTGITGDIIITGDVTIPGIITVNSSPEDPVHTHISEVGTSGILNVPYMPIQGSVTQGTNPWVISRNTSANASDNPIYVNITNGTIAVTQSTTPWQISKDSNPNSATNGIFVKVINEVIGIQDNGDSITVDGTVGVTQSTDPWVISRNTSANASGNPIYVSVTNGSIAVTDNNTTLSIDDGGGSITIDGSVSITGNTSVTFPAGATNLFGELYSSTLTPTVQLDAIHGVDPLETQTYTALGGSVDYSGNEFACIASSTTGSYALVRSRDFNPFRSGESMLGRWLTKFSTAKDNTVQRIGLNNQESGFYIGYNGQTFGLLKISGGHAPVYKITVTSYSGAQTVTLTLNNTVYTISVPAGETTNQVARQFTTAANAGGAWLACQRDNEVYLLWNGNPAPLVGTFSISSSGNMVAAVTVVQAGVATTSTWYTDNSQTTGQFSQPAWLIPTNYNSYAIKYVWPRAIFYAFNPTTVQYEYIGRIIGIDTLPVTLPVFKCASLAVNNGGGAVTCTTTAMYMAVEGIEARVTNTSSAAITQTSLAQNVLHHLLSIENPYVFVPTGKINTQQCNPLDLTVSLQCNDPSQIYIYIDTPLATGAHDFVSQDGKSVTVCSVTGTLNQSTSYPIISFIVGTTGTTTQFNLTDYRVNLPPGSIMSVAVYSTASINKASAAITWHSI